jgi:hypothetical protein
MTTSARDRMPPAAAGPAVRGRPWFGVMLGLWIAFFTLLVASEHTLGDIWSWIGDLPLVLELVAWVLALPWMLALAAWESSWDGWLRLTIAIVLALCWTAASAPRPAPPRGPRPPGDPAPRA